MPRRVLNRVKFAIERTVLRGAHYRLLLIAAAIGLVSVLAGAAVHLWAIGFEGGLGDAVWWAFLRLSDPGYLGDDQGTLLRTVSTIVTVLGYVLFLGALIAIMTQWLNETIRDLESGLTPIALSNHVLILGWTNRTPAVVRELLLSEGRVRRFLRRRGARSLRIVILAERVTSALSQELRERLGRHWDEGQIVLRSGTPIRIEHLKRVDFLNASAILLPAADFAQGGPAQADTHAIKTLLSITNQAVDRSELPPAVAEIFDARKTQIAVEAYGGPIEILASDTIVSRLVAQNVRHRNLSHIYGELLTHGRGNEIYIRETPQFEGAPMADLPAAFPHAILLGLVRRHGRSYSPLLNPPPDRRLAAEERLVLLARSYRTTEPEGRPVPSGPLATRPTEPPPQQQLRRVLVLGWNHKAPALIREFDSYTRERFEVDIVSALPIRERERELGRYGLDPSRTNVRQVEADYTAPSDLRRVGPAAYDNIVFLASDWLETGEESDARTILGYLLLRDVVGDGPRPQVLVELLDPANVSLFRRRPGEVLISPLILSHMLAQVALRQELRAVFDELFGPGGGEICFRSPERYGLAGQEVTFRDLAAHGAAAREVVLGVRIPPADGGGASGIQLNPSREQRFRLRSEDEVIALTTPID